VVNQDNKVELRQLKASRTVGSDWLIEEGLNAGDRLITEGLQYVAQASRSRSAKRPTCQEPGPRSGSCKAAAAKGVNHVEIFIDRPIFAWVIALVIMLVGALSILKLPINQYPSIAPPAIAISVTYPGASAQTVQDTVVQVIEQQLNGIDNLRYVSSESNSDGSMTITATFEQGTNPTPRRSRCRTS
jgi:hypothetical protein